jgi:L-lactate dehydrogenase complex protein LldG
MAMSEIANPSRARILRRIGTALRDKTSLPTATITPLFAPVTNSLQRFVEECKANITETIVTRDGAESGARLRLVLAGIPEGEVFAEDTPEIRQLLQGFDGNLRWSSDGPPAESSRATITRCHALVALTGSVVTSSACGGRGASVVAPVHVVIARQSQIVPDLESALKLVADEGLPQKASYVGLITGCSRTGDIEKQLVIGAHGPQRVVVILEVNS